ncbi:MAG: hypothetical protein HOI95_06205 [Chromatiales bacterium]|jgi:hypothetical protein|nr:hypothetical protein [Chromatiales bacterium]
MSPAPAAVRALSTGIRELFTAAALALVVGSALAMSAVGLSMSLGAFIAGMLVADSEYRHQLEADVTRAALSRLGNSKDEAAHIVETFYQHDLELISKEQAM